MGGSAYSWRCCAAYIVIELLDGSGGPAPRGGGGLELMLFRAEGE